MKYKTLILLVASFIFCIYSCESKSYEETEADYDSFFTQEELYRITYLKSLVPDYVISDFDEKYLTWRETWNRPEIRGASFYQNYARSEEYYSLLSYCLSYGKALYPLIFDKVVQGDIIILNLLLDMTDGGLDYLKLSNPLFLFWDTYVVKYSKKLITKEYDNILKAIHNIPKIENENNTITVNNQEN